MQTSIDISTKSDIINFIVFKRRLRQQIKRLSYILIAVLFFALIGFCIYKKSKFVSAYEFINNKITNITNALFEVDIKKVRIHLDKKSIFDDNEVDYILKKLSSEKINRTQMKQVVDEITEENQLIDNVYIRKTLANGELSVFIKEKKVIGISYDERCLADDNNCKPQSILTIDNKVIPFHKMKTNNEIIKVYGKIGVADLSKIYKTLKKYNLLEKTAYIKFYTSGRFDLMLKNKLLLKFPRTKWEKSIQQFNKLDAEYLLSNDIQSIKYIDLRLNDKVFIQ